MSSIILLYWEMLPIPVRVTLSHILSEVATGII